jgi:hypothetical protein
MRTSRLPRPADPPVRSRPRRRRRAVAAIAVGVLAAGVALLSGTIAGTHVAGDAQAATAPKGSPYGVAEQMSFYPGGMTFAGWAVDPSSPTRPVTINFVVDNKVLAHVTANAPRPDIKPPDKTAGPNHGFRTFVVIPAGKHTVCVQAKNIGAGADVTLRCQNRVLDYDPIGAIQKLQAAGGKLVVSGWATDLDQRLAPLTVTLTVDGHATRLVADDPNSAVVKVKPKSGQFHGFTFIQPLAQGTHSVCVRVTNLGYGKDKTLVCKNVTLNDSPRGHFDSAVQSGGKLRIKGWGFDPETPTAPVSVLVQIDGVTHTVTANATRTDVGKAYPNTGTKHGFDVSYALTEGSHQVCVTVRNVGLGQDLVLPCKSATLKFTPTVRTNKATATRTGLQITGWATDPDTAGALKVQLSLDGGKPTTVTADGPGSSHSGHNFTAALNTDSGTHKVCAVAINLGYGTRNSAASCQSITLKLNPLGHYDTLTRVSGSTDVQVKGWAFDPDDTKPLKVGVTIDGTAQPDLIADKLRTDVAKAWPSGGSNRGFLDTLATDDGEHTVCLTAKNVGSGKNTPLGCKTINAVHPLAPSAPGNVTAQAGFGGATVYWTPPIDDGGAPWTKYLITASPTSGSPLTVAADATSATVTGLKPSTSYTFTVAAVNVAGTSLGTVSAAVKTQASPPPQTTPAPVSTSRYIRNIRGASATDLATMRSEGVADAKANPSGHGYLILLDIGGQDHYNGGVVLSATTRFVSYANLVKDIQSYVDGYAAGQRASAPVMIAIGTNNDMDVSTAAGKEWADKVVDPVVSYTKKNYPGITIAGANDIEPGFRNGYSATKSWLTGYLGATTAPFVFNGSADGCSWTATNRGCNNGWSMAGLYYLAAGAAPIRTLNLPQIYNYTMADQWKYISLTGIGQGKPRINFAGPLTEWTACDQARSCGSITGHSAWSKLWSNLQSDSRLKVSSLPYSTDLRIDS